MKKLFLIVFLLTFALLAQDGKVRTGLEVLINNNFDILKGKRVGLVTNPTGVDSRLHSTVDIFFKEKSFSLKALFGPEHGVRGDFSAGAVVKNYTDSATQLPVYSLYGDTRKPTKEMLKDIDVLVYDIQDIGCRSYTYISTMGMIMEAGAENNIPVVILDRPNPLGGERFEGNITEATFKSFVSQFPIPYVYGLTCGELAVLINNEKMLTAGQKCDLTIVKMENWNRKMTFSETGLPWVPTSPHVPNYESAFYYVASGILGELGVVSEGVGYTIPFQTYAAEWINSGMMADKMNSLNLEGVLFRPISFKPYYTKNKDKELHGVQIYITDYSRVELMKIQFLFMEQMHLMYPEKDIFKMCDTSRLKMFDKVCGTDKIRLAFSVAYNYKEIQPLLATGLESYKNLAKKYFLY